MREGFGHFPGDITSRALGFPAVSAYPNNAPQTQEVVGYGDKQHNAGDFGKPSYAELGHSVKTYLSIGPFGHRAPLPVYGFGLLGGHPLPPRDYFRSILVAGLVTLLLRPVSREAYRRVHGHSSLLQSGDVLPGSKAAVHAVHKVGIGVLVRPPDHLFLHRCCLACVRALRGDRYAHDDSLGAIGGQLHIVSRSEAAIRHLHHSCLGICGGDPCLRHLGALGLRLGVPLAFLFGFRLGQVPQRLLDTLLSLSCGTLSCPSFPTRHPKVRMLTLLHQPFYLYPRLLQTPLQSLLATKGCRTGARPHPHPVLSHTLPK